MKRFTLRARQWYACMLLGDEFASAMRAMSPTPIRIDRVTPLATGNRILEVSFFHANYPQGVQDKTYRLQTIHRGENGLLARSTDHNPPRFLYVTVITPEWLKHNFPEFAFESSALQDDLNRAFGDGK